MEKKKKTKKISAKKLDKIFDNGKEDIIEYFGPIKTSIKTRITQKIDLVKK